jgi:hypothetical protein
VERTAEGYRTETSTFFNRPLHGLRPLHLDNPSDESLGYFQTSANAD